MHIPGCTNGAVGEQRDSLRRMEAEAIADVLSLHSLPDSDAAAVKSWGRFDVLADSYSVIVSAISTSAAERTTDQQNALDWVSAAAQQQASAAAQSAALEYVKWAGLDCSDFAALLGRGAGETELRNFLSQAPTAYNNTITGGYLRVCVSVAVRERLQGPHPSDLLHALRRLLGLSAADTELRRVRQVGTGGGHRSVSELRSVQADERATRHRRRRGPGRRRGNPARHAPAGALDRRANRGGRRGVAPRKAGSSRWPACHRSCRRSRAWPHSRRSWPSCSPPSPSRS